MKRDEVMLMVVLFLGVVLLVSCPWVLKSYFEARAFERMTGKPATTWDAMFLDLRVVEPAQRAE